MNWQAGLDALLMVVALWAALGPARAMPAGQLGCLILAAAALLGTLRFSGVLPLPPLHMFVSALGACVAMPLLAAAVLWPQRPVARVTRFAWVLGVILAVLYVLVGVVAGIQWWTAVWAVLSALAIIGVAVVRRQWLVVAAGASMLAAFVLFALKVSLADWRPGEFLHLGLAIGLGFFARWLTTLKPPPVLPANA